MQFTVDLPAGVELEPEPTSPTLAFSPDGKQLFFVALKAGDLQIFVRAIDAVEVKPVAGTVGADNPFISPDAQWLGFSAKFLVNKVTLSGGTPVPVMSARDLTGASWSVKNEISLAPTNRSGLVIVPASGGASRPMTTLDASTHETSHRFPEFLPDGEAVLFTAGPPANSGWYDADIVVQSLATGERHVVIRGAAQVHYVRTGHLVYARAGSLYAVPFDVKRLQVSGPAIKVLDGVSEDQSSGDAQFAVSAGGSLAYVPGGLRRNEVLRVDRSGKTEPLIVEPESRLFRQPRFSPDGKQIAVSIASGDGDVWVFDVATRVLNRFTVRGQSRVSGLDSGRTAPLLLPIRHQQHPVPGRRSQPATRRRAPWAAVAAALMVAGWCRRDGDAIDAVNRLGHLQASRGQWAPAAGCADHLRRGCAGLVARRPVAGVLVE